MHEIYTKLLFILKLWKRTSLGSKYTINIISLPHITYYTFIHKTSFRTLQSTISINPIMDSYMGLAKHDHDKHDKVKLFKIDHQHKLCNGLLFKSKSSLYYMLNTWTFRPFCSNRQTIDLDKSSLVRCCDNNLTIVHLLE